MCDGSGLTPQMSTASGGASFGSSSSITRRQLLKFVDDFTVIDIREESERKDDEEKEYIKNIQFIPMGRVLSGVFLSSDEGKKILKPGSKVCFICPRGGRAKQTADWFYHSDIDIQAYYLKGGLTEYLEQEKGKVVIDDDFLMILTHLEDDPEKVGVGLQLCVAAGNKGKTVTLVLMHNATRLATKSYAANNKLICPQPLKPWNQLLKTIVAKQGNVYCCNTCLKIRKIEDNDLIEVAKRIKGPDVIDMKEFCKMNFMM